ncbi:hypothetical protein [Aurantivibrio plasticivorans]
MAVKVKFCASDAPIVFACTMPKRVAVLAKGILYQNHEKIAFIVTNLLNMLSETCGLILA